MSFSWCATVFIILFYESGKSVLRSIDGRCFAGVVVVDVGHHGRRWSLNRRFDNSSVYNQLESSPTEAAAFPRDVDGFRVSANLFNKIVKDKCFLGITVYHSKL